MNPARPSARAPLAGFEGLAAALVAWACGASEDLLPRAPTAPRAVVVAEPPQLRVGEVGTLEVAVVTPPHHAVRPLQPPDAVAGLWLLDAERLPVEKEASRWIHRTRLRVRAHQVGSLAWPSGRVEVETPDGSLAALAWEPLPLEVVSVLPEFPDRLTPFGARAPPPPSPLAGLAAAAGGAALALAGVGLAALVRRRASRSRRAAAPPAPIEPPWVRARDELAAARRALAVEPLDAANAAAGLLRRYAAARFGADTVARTVEELAAARPPFAATTRWPGLVSVLRGLDGIRFRPVGNGAESAALSERVAGLLAEAERFVEETTPPEPGS